MVYIVTTRLEGINHTHTHTFLIISVCHSCPDKFTAELQQETIWLIIHTSSLWCCDINKINTVQFSMTLINTNQGFLYWKLSRLSHHFILILKPQLWLLKGHKKASNASLQVLVQRCNQWRDPTFCPLQNVCLNARHRDVVYWRPGTSSEGK